MKPERIRHDFDEIARLSDCHGGGTDRYDSFLLSLVPNAAVSVLDVGCGLGRLTAKLARPNRVVTGVDLSPEMIARARQAGHAARRMTFLCGDFLARAFTAQRFDCVISAAALHHMPADVAVPRMVELLRPGGRLVLHDMRSDAGLGEWVLSNFAQAQVAALRLLRTGRLRSPRAVREAWARHCADEKYLTQREAEALAARLLPGARLFRHWLWSYTIVWDKPHADEQLVGRSRQHEALPGGG
ncbi:MAG: methyltransferase domain-containing protein [Pyrinomonadaceae bacterium]